MNNLQIILLNIAKEYIRVCELLNLNYFAIGGTLLGAIRHNGFIPWDDDMDFAMPRKDYDVFVTKGQKFLPNYLFIQTNKTDKHYFNPYCKVRNINTTMIEDGLCNLNICHGCWIDIFPLDGIPKNNKRKEKFIKITNLYSVFLSLYHTGGKVDYGRKLNLFFVALKKYYFLRKLFLLYRDGYIKRVQIEQCDNVWINLMNCDFFVYEKKWFGAKTYSVFEKVKMRVPDNYKMILQSQYGDWNTLPPVEKRVCKHKSFVDLQKPYVDYIKKI